ncbi:MAG: hypothetical protein JOS17DRAFT_382430 [Linnemannia elongata]|nr:MAG: hypothetical protein JOS17DRAFT_382430 [Linnemannia elongata]
MTVKINIRMVLLRKNYKHSVSQHTFYFKTVSRFTTSAFSTSAPTLNPSSTTHPLLSMNNKNNNNSSNRNQSKKSTITSSWSIPDPGIRPIPPRYPAAPARLRLLKRSTTGSRERTSSGWRLTWRSSDMFMVYMFLYPILIIISSHCAHGKYRRVWLRKAFQQ